MKLGTFKLALAFLLAAPSMAQAETLKVAISQKGFWDSSFVEFGEMAGFYKDEGLEIEPFYTDGGAATLTTVLSGSADIGLSNGLLGVIGAYLKGAPVRVISAQMTGAGELYWYARAESGIKSLKDAGGKTVAFSSPGSSSNLIALALVKQAGVEAKLVATGGVPATLTQVMTRQIDVGWSVVPFGLQNVTDGKTVIVARVSDLPELAGQTIRVNIAGPATLAQKRDAVVRFMRAYARAIDWAYRDPRAIDRFAENMKVPRAIAQRAVDEFYPKASLQIGEIRGLEQTLKDALDFKYIAAPKTPQDIAGLFDVVYRPPQ
ncbi:MAG TPA: ABC transporter substrate-binding protein [Xanthobacteraceae bacterium]|nr:ABC transporter substrate-binding protein [Xanthobacteraceae bacterium]